jgi:large subunit ribosomal protein L16
MTRKIKRGGKVWIRVFPHKPITQKGAEVPMGSGKGSVDHFVFDVSPGKVLFEMEGVSEELAREALRLAGSKLSVRTKFIQKDI